MASGLRALALDQRSIRSAATAAVSAAAVPRSGPSASQPALRRQSTTAPRPASQLPSPASRARQLLSPLRKDRRPRRSTARSAVNGPTDEVYPEASTSQISSVGRRNAPLETLETLLDKEGRVKSTYAYNTAEVTRAKRVWEAYLKIEDHSTITVETWRAIVDAVVPKSIVAANHRPKHWRTRKLTEYFELGFDDRLERVLRDKLSVGLTPTEEDLLFMLEQFASAGSVKRSEEVFQRLIDRGFTPSEESFAHRLKAIQIWLWRYDSHEARDLIAKGDLMSRAQAVAHVPDLVASIMVQVQACGFAQALPDRLVDEACLIYARIGSWERFNSLVRWGYGVDLDVPDAIPQEYLDRVTDDDASLSRGMRRAGLEALLILCMNAGQPWRALSSLEIFAYDTVAPPHLHPALSRRYAPTEDAAEREEERERDYLRFAPPLPPSSALALMNLRATPINVPEDYAPLEAEAERTASVKEPTFFDSPTKGVMYEVVEAERRFRPAAIVPDHRMFSILLHGLRDMAIAEGGAGVGGSLVALYQHVLTRALADHYQERQRVMGAFLELLSHPAEAADVRQAAMKKLRRSAVKVRPHWFAHLRHVIAGEDARAQFKALGWAETELRNWRLAVEMDSRILQKALGVLISDRRAAVAELKTSEGHAFRESEAETMRIATDYKYINLRSVLHEAHWGCANTTENFRLLAEARVRAAWADLQEMHSLLEDGYPPSHELADGSTISSRVDEYAALLSERLCWELEPSSAPATAGVDPLSVVSRFAAFSRVIEQNSFGPDQLKANSRLLLFPTTKAPNLLELGTESYEPPMHPTLVNRETSTSEGDAPR